MRTILNMSSLAQYEFVQKQGSAGFQARDFKAVYIADSLTFLIPKDQVQAWFSVFPSVGIAIGGQVLSALGIYFFSGLSFTGSGAHVLALKLDNQFRDYPQKKFFHHWTQTLLKSEAIQWDGNEFVIRTKNFSMYRHAICGVSAFDIIYGGLPYRWETPLDDYDKAVVERYCGRFPEMQSATFAVADFFLAREKVYMQYSIGGPTSSEIRFSVGKGSGPECELLYARRRVILSLGEGTQFLPELGQLLILHLKTTLHDSAHFKDMALYNRSMLWFTLTTFEHHRAQVEEVLRPVPLTKKCVFPGDGWGVGNSLRPGSISGDLSFEGNGVCKESFGETLARSLPYVGNRVLVLSYLVNMLDDSELALLHAWKEDVIIVDVACHLPYEQLGPCVWANCLDQRFAAKVDKGNYVLAYTENVLKLSNAEFGPSNYKTYLKVMTPRASLGELAFVRLQEFFDSDQVEAYFGPAGRRISKESISTVEWGQYKLLCRTLYYLPNDFPLTPPCLAVYRGHRIGLFPFVIPGVKFQMRTPKSYADVVVEVVERPTRTTLPVRKPTIIEKEGKKRFSYPVGHTDMVFESWEEARSYGVPANVIASFSAVGIG